MTRTFAVFNSVVLVILASAAGFACSKSGDRGGTERAGQSVTAALTDREAHGEKTGADSSPFIVGVWKFIPGYDKGTPAVDTEFRFINPTDLDVTLEYAFFEADDGKFCGCDRDDLQPNKTTIYTVLGESINAPAFPTPEIPFQFSCHGQSGALKAIVFRNKGQKIFLDDATQVGFQLHAFGGIVETPDGQGNFNFLQGTAMTESPMLGIAITDSTRDDVRIIHEQCSTILGKLD